MRMKNIYRLYTLDLQAEYSMTEQSEFAYNTTEEQMTECPE